MCHGLDSAPAPRMSAPTQSHAPTCARACPWPSWSSKLHHPHARKLLLPCSRRSSWLQALTLRRTREVKQDAHSSVSDRRSSSSAARTLFRRCSTPSCIGRFKFSSHSLSHRSTHYDTFTHLTCLQTARKIIFLQLGYKISASLGSGTRPSCTFDLRPDRFTMHRNC